MFNLASQFEQLMKAALDESIYNADQAQYGATLAGIKMQERLDAFHKFVDEHAAEILTELEK